LRRRARAAEAVGTHGDTGDDLEDHRRHPDPGKQADQQGRADGDGSHEDEAGE
jgi:hypothetical protein